MVLPIPLCCGDNAGSGFLVTQGERVWLVTCVHTVSGLRETPLIASLFDTAQIRVIGTCSVLPLFVRGQQRFSLVTNNATGSLIDVIAIRLVAREIAHLISFGMFELGSIVRAKVGDTVTVSGFAGLGQMLTSGATEFKPTKLYTKVDEIVGVSVRLANPSALGLSGGPVVNDSGLIGIVHGDVGSTLALTSALVISLNVVADQLFC